ncbi:hypothetical protein C8J56DRAFT_1057377 [Mycena floridula]|nr:hypothetical protein C8J56DRAFT_1057377 [Mycena floridula]
MAIGSNGIRESFLGVFLENIVYGIYLCVFMGCCILLWRKHRSQNSNQYYVLVTSGLMFILITIRAILDTTRCIVAFAHDTLDFGPPNTKMLTATNAAWLFVTAVGDAFIIYRTFIVWKRNWYVIVLPTMLFLANIASSIWLIYSIVKFDPEAPIFGEITKSVDAFIYLMLFTNLICTSLISYRIIRVRQSVSGSASAQNGTTSTSKIVSIIVESAAIYTLMLIGQLITDRLDSFYSYVIVNCIPATIGIVFSYIIIRVSRGSSFGDTTVNGGGTTSVSRGGTNHRAFELGPTRTHRRGITSQVQIKLEHTTHQHSDIESSSKDDGNEISKYSTAPV